jgi:hypothetical protein
MLRMNEWIRIASIVALALAWLIPGRGAVAAQVITADTVVVSAAPPAPARTTVSPRGAMIRSWLVPGWGQASVGSHVRGGFWFSIQGTSWYMLLKTIGRLNQAKNIERRLVAIATDSLNELIAMDSLLAEELSDPIAFENAVGEHTGVNSIRGLVDARGQQRQDWITYTIFFTLISGVDAYVNAHLRDFPVDITTVPSTDGSVRFTVSVPTGSVRSRQALARYSAPAPRLHRW